MQIKQQTFEGQKMHILPQKAIQIIQKNELTKDLYLTDIGYFPNASKHYKKRDNGSLEYILIFCINGSGWIKCNGENYTLSKNHFFIIPKETPHEYGASLTSPWTIYWIHFSGIKAHLFLNTTAQPISLLPKLNEQQITWFNQLIYTIQSDYSIEAFEYCSILLALLLGSLKYKLQFKNNDALDSDDPIAIAIAYMKDNLHNNLDLNSIAKQVQLSVSHLSLIFKKQTSQSPIDYYINLKMQHACSLLTFSHQKIKSIAMQVGYNDALYFTRMFKKIIGISPSTYREKKENSIL